MPIPLSPSDPGVKSSCTPAGVSGVTVGTPADVGAIASMVKQVSFDHADTEPPRSKYRQWKHHPVRCGGATGGTHSVLFAMKPERYALAPAYVPPSPTRISNSEPPSMSPGSGSL